MSNCDAKSYCDPGYGAEWSEIGPCPLRVCCSKWGFCGLTKEFCGDEKVRRPSCAPTQHPIRRVVGYYEGWAARRKCMAYLPSDIKLGVYTHLNFAFAGIDPVTFAVIPADPGDVGLYTQLTDLKKNDPNLKVYIAIGGWDFNEPWNPTATTFSDLVASEANQRAFFTSLISYMATYDFDGVDIDWEYPAADDRAGRPADFENFPIFIRNLKTALATSSGGRNGLTLTLPVSYWYLRHFDIVKLQDSVEFFNIMSYDLHGTWDEGKDWTQPWLNSHTNLTEITEYLDLLWRNDIAPDKVVLGLAFYSRTFGLANPSCMSPGGNCYFHSGGAPGRCSTNVGTLMGAEVKEILDTTGIQPVLDRAAAVKMFSYNNAWITYDDLDTFRLKVRFAQSQCLGGVMVWAVSQDSGQTYSGQLQEATGFKSPGITFDVQRGQVEGDPDIRLNRDQCRWSGCGEGCGLDYYPVFRTDSDRHSDTEYMMDPTGCKDGSHHTLCCPAYGPYPKCGWYDFWNGGCGGKCPSGFTQIGSLKSACHTSKPQAACCTHRRTNPDGTDLGEMRTVALYNNCQWEGNDDQPDCPLGESSSCNRGTKLVASGDADMEALFDEALRVYMEKPECSYRSTSLTPRDGTVYAANASSDVAGGLELDAELSEAESNGLAARQPDQQMGHQNAQALVIRYAQQFVNGQMNQRVAQVFATVWNAHMLARQVIHPDYLSLTAQALKNFVSRWVGNDRSLVLKTDLCDLDKLAEDTADTQAFTEKPQCSYIWRTELAFNSDGDDGGDESDGLANKRKREELEGIPPPDENGNWPEVAADGTVYPYDEIYQELYGRATAATRGYAVDPKKNDKKGAYNKFTVRSSGYPNGGDGDELILSNGDSHRYLVKSKGCGPNDYELVNDAKKADAPGKWVSEHILELQAFPRFLEAAASGVFLLPSPLGGGTQVITKSGNALIYPNMIRNNMPNWGNSDLPSTLAMSHLGSVAHSDTMVVCESALNAIKSRVS